MKAKSIKQLFTEKKRIFVPFTVLGDPDIKTSTDIIKTYIDNGADMLELGIAFSDPTADGPVIQEADQRVLQNGVSLDDTFKILKNIRSYSNIPISLLSYLNPIYKYGIDKFYKKMAEIGVQALLIADLPLEEIALVAPAAKKHGINQVFLVHEKTTPKRLKQILKYASGYLYLVASRSTTGAKSTLPSNLKTVIKKLQKHTSLPLIVGFGISEAGHLKQIANFGGNGVIVGSKLVDVIKANLKNKSSILQKMAKEIKLLLS